MEVEERIDNNKEMQSERTLARIAESENSRQKVYTFGVVVDICEPFQLLPGQDFTSKIKVIDPTFNYDSVIENEDIRFQNYVYVYVYSAVPDKLPKIVHIGDIIRLRRFNFFINDKGELAGHMQKYSNWMTFDVTERDKITIQSCMQIVKNESRTLTQFEEDKIRNLKKWVHNFFSTRSIRSIVWWSKLKPVGDDSLVLNTEIKDIDLVLCTKNVSMEKQRIEFFDEQRKKYLLYLEAIPVLAEGQVIKLRSVTLNFAKEGRMILLNNKSSCLVLPDGSFDHKLFNEEFYLTNKDALVYKSPQIRKRGTAGNFETRKAVLEVYPFLEDYYFEDFLINKKHLIQTPFPNKIYSNSASIIKKEFNNKLPSLLGSFLTIANKNYEEVMFQKFVVSVNIVEIKQSHFNQMVYTFCESCQKSRQISDTNNFVCCQKILSICIVVCVKLTDESLEDDQTISAFIVTKSIRNNPFLLWKVLPVMDDYKSWAAIGQAEFKDFQTKLEALKKFGDKVKMVLEIKETRSHKLFFEVSDTLFLP